MFLITEGGCAQSLTGGDDVGTLHCTQVGLGLRSPVSSGPVSL